MCTFRKLQKFGSLYACHVRPAFILPILTPLDAGFPGVVLPGLPKRNDTTNISKLSEELSLGMRSNANSTKYGLSRFFGFFHFSLKSTWLIHTVQVDANGCKWVQMDATDTGPRRRHSFLFIPVHSCMFDSAFCTLRRLVECSLAGAMWSHIVCNSMWFNQPEK